MKIYTKTGDTGETGLPARRVMKSDPVVEALGELDELNSVLGWASVAEPPVQKTLKDLQSVLLDLGACVADTRRPVPQRVGQTVERLEVEIDAMDAKLPPLTQFVLPGGCEAGARLHIARSVCRRAERALVNWGQDRESVRFLNRLSDWLFVAARFTNHPDHSEPIYQKPC
jgi:cob(I)alamin adenosyltransferase